MTAADLVAGARALIEPLPGHTPPWQVAGVRHSGDLKIGKDARLHFVGPDGDAVAAVFYDMATGRGYSDARLIAASPVMRDTIAAQADHIDALKKRIEALEAILHAGDELISQGWHRAEFESGFPHDEDFLKLPLNNPGTGDHLVVASLSVEDSGVGPALLQFALHVLKQRAALQADEAAQ